MTPAALIALADRVEGLDGPDREVDAAIADVVYWDDIKFSGNEAFTASLDAAMTLVPEGWLRSIDDADCGKAALVELYSEKLDQNRVGAFDGSVFSRAPRMAQAVTAAALRARAKEMEG